MENVISCPDCGSYNVISVSDPDNNGNCEYHCDDCGSYFVDTYDDE